MIEIGVTVLVVVACIIALSVLLCWIAAVYVFISDQLKHPASDGQTNNEPTYEPLTWSEYCVEKEKIDGCCDRDD